MKVTFGLALSIVCAASAVWAGTTGSTRSTTAAPTPAAAQASPKALSKLAAAPVSKVKSLAELQKLRATMQQVEVRSAAAVVAPTPSPAPAATGTPYQQASGVALTVNNLRDTAIPASLRIYNVIVDSDTMTGPMRWLTVQPRSLARVAIADAWFSGLPSGVHTYIVSLALGPNNGSSAEPVFIEVDGTLIPANAIVRNSPTSHGARALFSYDSKSGGTMQLSVGWTPQSTADQMLVFQYVQLVALD